MRSSTHVPIALARTKGRPATLRKAVVASAALAVAVSTAVSAPAYAAPSTPATTTAEAAATSDVPQPDIISVDFTTDGPVEHVKNRPVTTEGNAPDVVYDEIAERYVAEFLGDEEKTSTGTGAYVYDIPDAWSVDDPAYVDGVDLLDGGTFECYFRYDGEIPVPSGQSGQLCMGGPEGYGFYLPATGCCLRFKATSTRSNVNTATAPIPVNPGEWVHAVATVGSGEVKLYLNGKPAWELEPEPGNGAGSGRNHVGPYGTLNVDSIPKWGIGAGPRADGIVQPAHMAVAASRAWSTVLTDAEVAKLWNHEKPSTAEEVDPGEDPGEQDPGEEDPGEPNPDVDVPDADVLDVNFSDATDPFRDHSPSNRAPKVTGTANVTADKAFATQPHNVYTADGQKDHAFYPLQDAWADTGDPRTDDMASWADDTWAGSGLTLQCDIKVNQALPVAETGHVCAGKSAGGFGLHLSNSSVVASLHINGGYKSISTPALQSGVWYSVVATFDGTEIDLYLDGKLVGTNATGTVGQIKAPTSGTRPEPYVRYFALGSDVAGNGSIESPASVSIGNARIWSSALNADQAARLDRDSFGDRAVSPELISSVPAAGAMLESPTQFAVTISDKGLATGWTYTLDGVELLPGDRIGEGMEAGEHEIAISATDVFGQPVSWAIPFTSLRIPLAGGTETTQEDGAAVLSATATGVDDSITTTFNEARVTDASGGFQGTLSTSPAGLGLDFDAEVRGRSEISGSLTPGDDKSAHTPASHDAIPFQRFDINLPNADRGQQLLWSGAADPTRTVKLWAWDNDSGLWSVVDESPGVADGDTRLQSEIHARMIDTGQEDEPVVHVVVTAEDPFSDNLTPRDESAGTPEAKDHFESPEDYDFSIVHYTDAQYTTEVASGSDMDWPASLPWRHIEGATNTPAESAVFEQSLRQQNQWIAENKEERKIGFVANTGDVINSNVSLMDLQFDPDAVDPGDGSSVYEYTTSDGKVPGAKEQIAKEFETVRALQEDLWNSGVPNQSVAGNHDNYNGSHNGPKSPFAAFFAADEYYDQAADLWPAGASYHAMDETTDPQTGAVETRGEDNSNSYVLFSAGGLEFVTVGLSYGVTQEESDWADSIFKRYSDRNGILVTHGYVSSSSEPDGRTGKLGADGSKLYDEVVQTNENVFLVLGGHFHGVGTNVQTITGAQSNHKVVQLLADYQGYLVPAETIFSKERCAAAGLDTATQCVFGTGDDKGKIDVDGDGSWDHLTTDKLAMGASFLRMLQFNTTENTMSVDTYSPFLDEFGATPYDHGAYPKTTPEPIDRYNGAEDNFTVPINLSTRKTSFATDGLTVATPTDTAIGTPQTVKSGTAATVRWTGLTEGEMYAWTASSTEAGNDAGVLVQFGGMFLAGEAGSPDPGGPGDGGGPGGPGDGGGPGGPGDGGGSGGSGTGSDNADVGEGGQDGTLPSTGAEVSTTLIVAAILLLSLGAGLSIFTRRRKAAARGR